MADELSSIWCLGMTWSCTPFEAIGIASVTGFYTTVIIVSIVHGFAQQQSGATRNEEATRRHTATDTGDDWAFLFSLLCYFFTLAAGCLLWALVGTQIVHPFQNGLIQLSGSAILVACAVLFIIAHLNLGENWSPEPEQLVRHQLVTHGLFRWARHPMYAIFLWAFVGTLLATLNWLVAWCVFGFVVLTLRRVSTEERILTELFGAQYVQYCRRVPALGPPWQFLGFDAEMQMATSSSEASDAHRESHCYHIIGGESESGDDDPAAARVAAEREAARHGCCCQCCSIRAEIWGCFVIDVTSILGLAVEIPGWAPVPAELHATDLFIGYLLFSCFSAGLIVFALSAGKRAAWPRRALVRLMSVKLPVFIIFVMGYFTLPPYAAPLAQWVCRNDFQGLRAAMGGGDYDMCVNMFSWYWTANNAPYILAYAYSLKAAHEWFRCHPGNDSKGIWCESSRSNSNSAAMGWRDGDPVL